GRRQGFFRPDIAMCQGFFFDTTPKKSVSSQPSSIAYSSCQNGSCSTQCLLANRSGEDIPLPTKGSCEKKRSQAQTSLIAGKRLGEVNAEPQTI
ncbi:MAG: hypothetical protein LLG04_04785, partial [Parachlamydia sp.]|nr:hypothetical protein [Parachlamydia sp.]